MIERVTDEQIGRWWIEIDAGRSVASAAHAMASRTVVGKRLFPDLQRSVTYRYRLGRVQRDAWRCLRRLVSDPDHQQRRDQESRRNPSPRPSRRA